ncbi:hypothetical protein RFI_02582 [Reticulomyxa filosa]|uniref:Uncharacterized protein n=1 Tax=Reticulomyxa filosa TaxID=46433 RepID=X6P8X4_RETFI|nr:hypothetical protein RFI_02582 [Reticulomyxa filosa]|eukprot:ETO34509.1 hypothetical protein RFI_02582 [Reticulomyxa filosa]
MEKMIKNKKEEIDIVNKFKCLKNKKLDSLNVICPDQEITQFILLNYWKYKKAMDELKNIETRKAKIFDKINWINVRIYKIIQHLSIFESILENRDYIFRNEYRQEISQNQKETFLLLENFYSTKFLNSSLNIVLLILVLFLVAYLLQFILVR